MTANWAAVQERSLAERAVRALLLCVRSLFDLIHHRVLRLLTGHWTAGRTKPHGQSRVRFTVVRTIRAGPNTSNDHKLQRWRTPMAIISTS